MRTALASVVVALLLACAPHREPTRYTPKTVPSTQPAVYLRRSPPAMRAEVISARPGPEYAWISGHWRWERDAYVWTPGRWERGPHANATWVQGSWQQSERGWYWTPGEWC